MKFSFSKKFQNKSQKKQAQRQHQAAQSDTLAFSDKVSLHQFSCHQCGAATEYLPSSQKLICTSCGHEEVIQPVSHQITETPLEKGFKNLRIKPLSPINNQVLCQNCGASSTWDIDSLSDLCPYCQTPIAKLDTENNRLQIEAIVPFALSKNSAKKSLAKWLKNRWFAPNTLKQMQGHYKQFEGIYLPHWTFDSLTHSDYSGLRGEYYIEYITQTRIVNGRPKTVRTPVTRTRWFRVAGQVRVMFDDILVLASMIIPKIIINRLRPWHLSEAVAYTPEYLAGLKSKYYQLDLQQAFKVAQQSMNTEINRAIRQDIGGDRQQIQHKKTRYQNSTYKLILLPVWYSSFEYRGKRYQTVINGQTGKVSGEYPKSHFKIIGTVILVTLLTTGVFYWWSHYGSGTY